MVLTLQVSLLVMWVVALAWLHARRGEWASAGLWLGFAGSVKPFLLLSLPYLAIRRQWTALWYALATVGGMLTLGVGVFGLESYREWLRQAAEITWGAHYMNASIMGVLERWIGRPSGYAPVFRARGLVAPLGIAVSGLVGLFTLRRIARDGQDPKLIDSEWASWLLASLLMSPLGWIYYLWLALPPLVVVSVQSAPWARRRASDLMWLFGVVGLLWFASMTLWGQPRPWATVTLGSMYFWALMALWLWTLGEVPRGARRAAR
jgi:Glycosyltransferase family 87